MRSLLKSLKLPHLLALLGGYLTLFITGCAAQPQCPPTELRLVVPSQQYFVPVVKPFPPREGELAFYAYVLKLSDSWDNLYIDRLKAFKELEEAKQ
jgi:hypothetical protein